MEHISSSQLEKYQAILNEIDCEYKKNEQLKKEVKIETNKLTGLRLAMEENFAKQNIFKILVKVFGSIFEIYYLHSDDIPNTEFEYLQKLSDCKFYVIEVYISKAFLQNVTSQKWLVSVSIKNSKTCVTKTTSINKRHMDGPVMVVVPFDTSTETATIKTTLFKQFDIDWTAIKFSDVITDVSYHFTSRDVRFVTSETNLIKITKSYNIDVDEKLLKLPVLDYNFKCKCTAKHFFESVVKNCYHRLNPQLFSVFTNEESNVISLDLTIDNEYRTVIKLNTQENVLSIVSNILDLHRIKIYFIEEITCLKPAINNTWRLAFAITMHSIGMYRREININNSKILYEECRKLMFDLVV